MSHQKKPVNITASQSQHLEDGINQEKSKSKNHKATIEDIKLLTFQKMKERDTYMLEYLHQNKKKTLNGKSVIFKKSIPIMKSSQISHQDLTLTDNDCEPYWTNSLKEISEKLWYTHPIDWQDLEMNYLPSFLKNLNQNSPSFMIEKPSIQKMRSQMTSSQLSHILQPNIMEKESTILTRKIRFYPCQELKIYLNKAFGIYRYFYNKTINHFKEQFEKQKNKYDKISKTRCIYQSCNKEPIDGNYFCDKHKKKKVNWKIKLNFIETRNQLLTKNNDLTEDEMWQSELPFDSRAGAIKDAISAYKGCLTKMKQRQITHFNLNFKSKKFNSQVLLLDERTFDIKNNNLIKSKKDLKFRLRKKNQKWMDKNADNLTKDFKVYFKKPDRYYFLFPMDLIHKTATPKYSSVALDPGIRTFQTFYSPEGIVGKIFNDTEKCLLKKGKLVDKLTSISKTSANSRKKKNLKRKCNKIRNKIKNIVYDLHNKTARWLCENFQNIFLGKINVKKIVKKTPNKYKKINDESIRNLLSLSHGKFRERLLAKGKLMNVSVYICNESYTSKTCFYCGKLNNELGSKKIFECKKCGIETDRDENGARNIWLRAIDHLLF